MGNKFSEAEIQKFSSELLDSGIPSIDEFLAFRRDFADIGKRAVAYFLISSEHPANLQRKPANAGHWYGLLWDAIRTPLWDQLLENRISIITFNYDRSLEYFLARAMHVAYERPLSECIDKVNQLRIIHVYGQLGKLTDSAESIDGRPYSTNVDEKTLDIAASGIRLIGERLESKSLVEETKPLISSASKICFLGFAYHPENMQWLHTDAIQAKNAGGRISLDICGTAKALKNAEVKKVAKTLVPHMDANNPFEFSKIQQLFPDADCVHLLRSRGVFT
jgi:hypothetical protein